MKRIRKAMALLFAVVLCLGMLPESALAAGRGVAKSEKTAVAASSRDAMLTFSDDGSFTLETANHAKNWNGTLFYSTDAAHWTAWDGTTTLSSDLHNGRQVLYLRGTGNSRISTAEGERWVLTGTGGSPVPQQEEPQQRWQVNGPNITCSGNIESLLDYQTVTAGNHPQMDAYCFAWLFSGCTDLAKAPDLSAPIMRTRCYEGMFAGCTGLVFAPALPAMALANYCYQQMFSGCTSLKTAPKLPAETLMRGCYSQMFSGCTALTAVPELPARELAVDCYRDMFRDCTGLTEMPVLPATTLAEGCYRNMFRDCTLLTTPPALPAKELVDHCYQSMFAGCIEIRLSEVQTDEYSVPYRIPSVGDSQYVGTDALKLMFAGTGGPFVGEPQADKTYYLPGSGNQPGTEMLTFSSNAPFTLVTANGVKNWDGKLEYSTDAAHWFEWDGAATLSSGTHGIYEKLYLRGIGNSEISTQQSQGWVLTGNKIACSGNIESLLDCQLVAAGAHPHMASSCFAYLFYNCSDLIAAPDLPATELTADCYLCMFSGCTALTTAPELPARVLSFRCYSAMFYDCTSLTNAPALPATELAADCYFSMFSGCTALTEAPGLPATTLADECYWGMFWNCTSLAATPGLPATTLAYACYRDMFYGCTSLMTAPALPATTLADDCYYEMFSECTSLAAAPVLPATTLAKGCYRGMFRYCTSLTIPPALRAKYLPDNCYMTMFIGCTGIRLSEVQTDEYSVPYRIPCAGDSQHVGANALTNMFYGTGGSFTGSAQADRMYYLPGIDGALTFSSGTPFTLRTANNAKNWNGTIQYSTDAQTWTTWDGTVKLNSGLYSGQYRLYLRGLGNSRISANNNYTKRWVLAGSGIACSGNIEDLLDYQAVSIGDHPQMDPKCFSWLFHGCTALTTAPKLPATTLTDSCYQYMFQSCKSLTAAPELPAETLTDKCYQGMFQNCESLTAAPELPAVTLTESCYRGMFQNCASLTAAPELPAETLAESCYRSMFQDCASLATAPALPAETLAESCYRSMFQNCTSLTAAPALPALLAFPYCYESMFKDCTSLTALPGLPAYYIQDHSYAKMFEGCTQIRLSEVQTGGYTIEFAVPNTPLSSGYPSGYIVFYHLYGFTDMFADTGGTFTGTPDLYFMGDGGYYYLHNTNSIVW